MCARVSCVCCLSVSLAGGFFLVHFQYGIFNLKNVPSQRTTASFHANSWKSDSEKMEVSSECEKGTKKTKIDSIISFFLSLSLILLWNLNIELKFSTRKSCNEYFKWQWVGSMAMHIEFQHTTRCTVANHLENQSNEKKGFELSAEFLMDSLVRRFYNSFFTNVISQWQNFHFPEKKLFCFHLLKDKNKENAYCVVSIRFGQRQKAKKESTSTTNYWPCREN